MYWLESVPAIAVSKSHLPPAPTLLGSVLVERKPTQTVSGSVGPAGPWVRVADEVSGADERTGTTMRPGVWTSLSTAAYAEGDRRPRPSTTARAGNRVRFMTRYLLRDATTGSRRTNGSRSGLGRTVRIAQSFARQA